MVSLYFTVRIFFNIDSFAKITAHHFWELLQCFTDKWNYYRALKKKSYPNSKLHLTVKRGVSLLISSNDTSTPITPRINWFYNKIAER